MGFWDSLKSFGRKALEIGGSIVKKVGEIAPPILRKVAEWAPAVTSTIGTGLDAFGAYTANPALVGLGETVRAIGGENGPLVYYANKGADWLSKNEDKMNQYSNMAYGLADKLK